MTAKSSLDLEADPRAIVGMREFDAPRDLVFSAFTDPRHLAQWWGPNGFTTTTLSFDMRPGGVWRFVMHGPDGRDYQNRITYEEVVPPQRIVYRLGGGDDVEPGAVPSDDHSSRISAAGRGSSGAAIFRRQPSATASSRNTAPTKAWCRRWRGSPNTWRRWRCEQRSRRLCSTNVQQSSRNAARRVSALAVARSRSVSACARAQTGAAAASSARPAAVRIKRRPRLSLLVDFHLYQSVPFEGLEVGGQGRSIHGKERRHVANARGFGAVERHQQRELALRQAERPQRLVEAPRQRARRPLYVQAKTVVASMMREVEGQHRCVRRRELT